MLTYFRSIGLPQANNYVDRFPPFVYKEKTKFSMFSKSNKKVIAAKVIMVMVVMTMLVVMMMMMMVVVMMMMMMVMMMLSING